MLWSMLTKTFKAEVSSRDKRRFISKHINVSRTAARRRRVEFHKASQVSQWWTLMPAKSGIAWEIWVTSGHCGGSLGLDTACCDTWKKFHFKLSAGIRALSVLLSKLTRQYQLYNREAGFKYLDCWGYKYLICEWSTWAFPPTKYNVHPLQLRWRLSICTGINIDFTTCDRGHQWSWI